MVFIWTSGYSENNQEILNKKYNEIKYKINKF